MNKKVMLLIPAILGVMLILPMVLAADPAITIVKPVASYNASGTMIVNISTDTAMLALNASLLYNASGGATGTYLVTITNTSADQVSFYNAAVSVAALSDGATYNVTGRICNATNCYNSAGRTIRIDNTAPTTTLTLETQNMQTRDSNLIEWTASDGGAGLTTVVTTVTSPDSSKCPTKTYTDTNGKYALTDDSTSCAGTYTVLVTATDLAGNAGTSTNTFKASSSGLSKSGSNTLGGSGQSTFSQGQEINSNQNLPLGNTGTNIAILLVVGGALYLFFKKK